MRAAIRDKFQETKVYQCAVKWNAPQSIYRLERLGSQAVLDSQKMDAFIGAKVIQTH